ncbi:MAG TPA: DUF92 domain-containing protein, partial [Calditrichaeota bacterium]|nr:DUF92 domain-containing protein [Calditrichota bacterium]
MNLLSNFAIGIILSGLISVIAFKRNSLSQSGLFGAMLIGTTVFGFGGLSWGALLFSFFILSTLFSHYKAKAKEGLAEKFEKGHQRDLGQTLANGGIGALLAVLYFFYPQPFVLSAFAGAMATVNADTWATELGVLAKHPPRLITSWKKVEVGTSGGISVQGTMATVAGASSIGLLFALFLIVDGSPNAYQFIFPAIAGGAAGSIFDSFLGATVQVIYYSPRRNKETEKKTDPDGTANNYLRGWRWLNNDWVNFVSSLVGA